MANLSKDIQCAGSDTRPPMLDRTNFDRTDFASWQQRIRLYCRGKENGVNILNSIDDGPFQMRIIKDPIAEGTEAVKLNRGLRDSNYDQLYAYLKQHEVHANENKMMLDRFIQHTVDPLALMSNVSHQQYYSQSSTTPPSTYVSPHFADNTQPDLGLSPMDNLIENLTNTLALLTQSYKTYLPQTNNQLKTLSNPRNQATVQDGRVVVQNVQGQQNRGQGNNARGAGTAGYGGAQNRVGNANPGQARQVKCYNCNADDYDAFDSDVDEAPMAQTMFMANLSSADPVYDEADNAVDEDVDKQPVQDLALNVDNGVQADDYAKTLFAAIQKRFSGNEATKKTQKTLLKQMYGNFSAPSTKSLESIFNRLQKIASQLAILVSTASTQVSTANLSDDTVYAFLASQPNGSQLVYEDLEQIHKDDIEEMDLKWQLALLSMRTRRFFQKTGRKITINGSDTTGYDKSKVECFNCHKMGHFARECRGPKNQDSRNRNQDSSRRTVNVEETSSKVMVAIDGVGFDWSYMADDEVPTNMALIAFSDSEVHNDKTCSKTCLKSFETLKTQLDDLRIEFNKSEFNLATYKRGLASVEEQLVFYKKNEVIFCEQLAVLKRDISYKDSEISMLKSELEKLKQEKESNQLKIENFDNASKSLDKLIGSQIPDKSRKGVGFASYNAVPPPPTGLFSPPKFDLSNSGLEEFQQPEFEGYGPKTSKSVSEKFSKEVRESPDTPLVEKLVSDDKLEKKTGSPTVAKIEFVRPKQQEKPVRKPVKYIEMYRLTTITIKGKRVVFGNNYTRVNYNYSAKKAHPNAHRNMVPRVILMKTGLRSLNTANGKFYTARPKTVNTARPNSVVVNAVRENQVNAVKASVCWVWRPTKLNSASITLKRHNYVDARGRSKVIHKKKIKAMLTVDAQGT
ncbi:ribonuclease H-like domain-containing protein [Tanacetum coccineum]